MFSSPSISVLYYCTCRCHKDSINNTAAPWLLSKNQKQPYKFQSDLEILISVLYKGIVEH